MLERLLYPLKGHLAPLKPRRAQIYPKLPFTRSQRLSSSYAQLHEQLTSRRLPLVFDYFSPTHSHLLNVSLADHLPSINIPSSAAASAPELRTTPSTHPSPGLLSPAHHIIYFPPAIPGPLLLPDGTDPLQSPGPPFVRRMWAGGRVRFNNSPAAHALNALDGQRAVCVEGIRDVSVKGPPGAEKIFVGVERRVGRCAEDELDADIRARLWPEDAAAAEAPLGADTAVVERRNIVFLRERGAEELQALKAATAAADAATGAKAEKKGPPSHVAQHAPDYSHTVYPDAMLLFRYSALMYNAHAIHLDPEYCRDVEGHRNLLVHGPLSFTFLLTLLRLHLLEKGAAAAATAGSRGKYEAVREVEYRNLAPLYSGEPLKLHGRRVEDGKYEIWAETPEGGLAVRGIVKTELAELRQGAKGPEDMFEDLALCIAKDGAATT